MKSMEQLVEEKRAKKSSVPDINNYLTSMKSAHQGNAQSTQAAMTMMKQAMAMMQEKWEEMSESQQSQVQSLMKAIPNPKTDVSVNLNGIEKIVAQSVEVEGLEEMLQKFVDASQAMAKSVEAIKTATENIKVVVPEIKVPDIHMPEMKMPEIKVPKPQVTINQQSLIGRSDPPLKAKEKEKPMVRVVSEEPIYENGELAGYVETFSDGTKHTERMTPGGGTKHTYA